MKDNRKKGGHQKVEIASNNRPSPSIVIVRRSTAVCIASGGLDSACLAASLTKNHDIYVITFVYGQRAKREIYAARRLAKVLAAKEHKVVDITFMKSLYGSSNALTDKRQKLATSFEQSLVVPIRNAIFITIASAWAMSINARVVAYGAHAGDISNYPDCRPEFADAIGRALNLADADSIASGHRQGIAIMSPAAIGTTKSELLKAGHEILADKVFSTWSCYSNGVRKGSKYLHCGKCESCINRKIAFTTAQIKDKTRYAA